MIIYDFSYPNPPQKKQLVHFLNHVQLKNTLVKNKMWIWLFFYFRLFQRVKQKSLPLITMHFQVTSNILVCPVRGYLAFFYGPLLFFCVFFPPPPSYLQKLSVHISSSLAPGESLSGCASDIQGVWLSMTSSIKQNIGWVGGWVRGRGITTSTLQSLTVTEVAPVCMCVRVKVSLSCHFRFSACHVCGQPWRQELSWCP